ncbi:MAG: hypothetical protein IKW83_08620 [Muribaculaceae bacterium]|nr:hypothetical protein [Muribaculaceae bacterium]
MKKFLFIAAIVALIMGTAVDASAKVRKGKGKKHQAQTSKTIKSNNQNMKVDQGMYTADDATRLANGDVADLEKAFIADFYGQYVFNGNIYNEAYLPYVKIKFSKAALSKLANADGGYDWSVVTGRNDDSAGITPDHFIINRLDGNWFEVCGADGFNTYLKVEGSDGAYKITEVSSTR